jgi:hypothetical protein
VNLILSYHLQFLRIRQDRYFQRPNISRKKCFSPFSSLFLLRQRLQDFEDQTVLPVVVQSKIENIIKYIGKYIDRYVGIGVILPKIYKTMSKQSIRKSKQCIADTLKQQRCRKRTAHMPKCWIHLAK